jgi:hypothetical protein
MLTREPAFQQLSIADFAKLQRLDSYEPRGRNYVLYVSLFRMQNILNLVARSAHRISSDLIFFVNPILTFLVM